VSRYAAAILVVLLAALEVSVAEPGSHEWTSYFQLRYTHSEVDGSYVSLRRLKLYGTGPAFGRWNYYLQFLYKTGNRSATDGLFLQEANIFGAFGRGRITFGQFKPPFGLERFTPDWKLALIDRTQPTDRLIPNGSVGNSFARDYGLQWEGPIARNLTLSLGLFAGSAANEPLDKGGPLLVGRAAYERRLAPDRHIRFELAASWRRDRGIDFSRQLPGAPVGYSSFSGRDIRQNLALACDAGPNSLRAEYFAAHFGSAGESLPSIDAMGYYVQYARVLSKRWAVAARYERFDPNRAVVNSKDVSWLSLGTSRFIRGDFEKVQINYVFKAERTKESDNDALLVQYQRFL
jgi:phosphate-selective porin